MKIADFVVDSRIGMIDRLLGFVFGALRGLLLLVIIFQFFAWLVPEAPSWVANARTRPLLENLGAKLIAAMPQDIEDMINRWRHGDEQEAAPDTGAAPADTEAPADEPQGQEEGYGTSDRQGLDQLIDGGQSPNQ
jgi:membrane protein required for colicin V production